MWTTKHRPIHVFVVVALLAAGIAWPGQGLAQSKGSVAADIRRVHILVLEDLDLGDYPAARAQLEKAIADAEASGLGDELVNAKSHAMLAGVLVIGFRDEAAAIEHFKVTLGIAPAYELEPPLNSPAIAEVMAKTDAILNPVVTCASLRGIDHKQVVRGKEGEALPVTFKAGPKLTSGTAHVHYRAPDQMGFKEVTMSRDGECEYKGEIPGADLAPGLLYYFVSMKKDDGRFIAMRGNEKSPFPVQILRTERSVQRLEAESQREDPDELLRRQQRKGGGCAGCSAGPGAPGNAGLGGWLALLALVGLGLGLGRRGSEPQARAG